jgi:hypothetical protein
LGASKPKGPNRTAKFGKDKFGINL